MARVLVVDDARVMRAKLGKMIKDAGHIVIGEAANGLDAYYAYKELLPDIVTMDITMPTMDGIKAVGKIIKKFPDARIIMTTSHSKKSMVLKAIKAGAKHYIVKPIRLEKLNEIVTKVFSDNPIESNVVDEIPPFSIKKKEDTYCVQINYTFRESDCQDLMEDMEKFFYDTDLKILFIFNCEIMNHESILKIGGLMINVIEINGELSIWCDSEKLREAFEEFDASLPFTN